MLDLSSSNRRVTTFFGKVILIYAAWYGVYDLWLLPDGRLDQWVSHSVVQSGQALLNFVGFDATAAGRTLALPGDASIQIIDGCNGIGTVGLFMGFVLAFPGHAIRRAIFIPAGILIIYLSNVARVDFLLVSLKYWEPGFDFVHDLGAPAFFYAIIFGLWILWANYGGSPTSRTSLSSPVEPAQPAPS